MSLLGVPWELGEFDLLEAPVHSVLVCFVPQTGEGECWAFDVPSCIGWQVVGPMAVLVDLPALD